MLISSYFAIEIRLENIYLPDELIDNIRQVGDHEEGDHCQREVCCFLRCSERSQFHVFYRCTFLYLIKYLFVCLHSYYVELL